MHLRSRIAAGVLVLLAGALPVIAATVEIPSSRDNTLYAEGGATSNGAGERVFAGTTKDGFVRRGLLLFDIAGSVPAGATILSVELELYCSKAAPGSSAQTVALHRVLADWGEAGSDGGFEEGQGAPAQPGDATWTNRFFGQATPWSAQGGDFAAAASATTSVGAPGLFYTWTSSQLTSDAQSWLDDPSSNFGWILRGNEVTIRTTRRFDSGSIEVDLFRPVLTVEYEEGGPTTPGAVPDGDDIPGTPLSVEKTAGTTIRLDWGAGCAAAGGEDYAVYEGSLGSWNQRFPVVCSTAGQRSRDVNPAPGGTYYLIVPVRGDLQREGSYGRRSTGAERTPGTSVCFTQELASPVCP